jgi:glutathione S-transferase
MLTLYQAEWCPYSTAVRELLTELGLDFVARQVAPWPEQRDALRSAAGTDAIPILETDDGRFFRGTPEIFAYLATLSAWPYADDHRRRFMEHAPARRAEVPARLVREFQAERSGCQGP